MSVVKRAGDTLGGLVASGDLVSQNIRLTRKSERQVFKHFWGWAVLWTVIWHVGWLLLPLPSEMPILAQAHTVVPLRYMNLEAQAGVGQARLKDVLMVKSPALFAMPHEEGFSSEFLQGKTTFAPPVNLPESQEVFHGEPPGGFHGQVLKDYRQLKQEAEARLSVLQAGRPADPLQYKEPGTGFTPSWRGLPDGMKSPAITFPATDSRTDWEARVFLRVGPAGLPVHAVLERPSPDKDWNQAFLRALYLVELPGVEKSTLKVKFRYREQGDSSL